MLKHTLEQGDINYLKTYIKGFSQIIVSTIDKKILWQPMDEEMPFLFISKDGKQYGARDLQLVANKYNEEI